MGDSDSLVVSLATLHCCWRQVSSTHSCPTMLTTPPMSARAESTCACRCWFAHDRLILHVIARRPLLFIAKRFVLEMLHLGLQSTAARAGLTTTSRALCTHDLRRHIHAREHWHMHACSSV